MSYSRPNLALNATHKVLLVRYSWIHIQCVDEEGEPLKEHDYEIEFPDGKKIEDKLDADGWCKHEDILPGECIFRLIHPPVRHLRLKFLDEDGEPFANRPFELEVGDELIKGYTNHEGRVIADITSPADDGELTIFVDGDEDGEAYTWPIKISQVAKPKTKN